jgi:hypothetical protein
MPQLFPGHAQEETGLLPAEIGARDAVEGRLDASRSRRSVLNSPTTTMPKWTPEGSCPKENP